MPTQRAKTLEITIAKAVEFWRGAVGAVEIIFGPEFGDDSCALRAAFVGGGEDAGHGKVHQRI